MVWNNDDHKILFEIKTITKHHLKWRQSQHIIGNTPTDRGSFNLTYICIVCVFRSFRLYASFFRFSFSVRLRFVRVLCSSVSCIVRFVYRSFRVSFASLIRRTQETKYERTIHEMNDTRNERYTIKNLSTTISSLK